VTKRVRKGVKPDEILPFWEENYPKNVERIAVPLARKGFYRQVEEICKILTETPPVSPLAYSTDPDIKYPQYW
jgi:hypothetical protein